MLFCNIYLVCSLKPSVFFRLTSEPAVHQCLVHYQLDFITLFKIQLTHHCYKLSIIESKSSRLETLHNMKQCSDGCLYSWHIISVQVFYKRHTNGRMMSLYDHNHQLQRKTMSCIIITTITTSPNP